MVVFLFATTFSSLNDQLQLKISLMYTTTIRRISPTCLSRSFGMSPFYPSQEGQFKDFSKGWVVIPYHTITLSYHHLNRRVFQHQSQHSNPTYQGKTHEKSPFASNSLLVIYEINQKREPQNPQNHWMEKFQLFCRKMLCSYKISGRVSKRHDVHQDF